MVSAWVAASLLAIVRTIVDADFVERWASVVIYHPGRAGKVDARIEVLNFRLDCIEGAGGRNAVDDNLVPDFIFPKSGG